MATANRNVKTGGTTKFHTEWELGFDEIKASEVDADLDTIFNAWNTLIPDAISGAGIPPSGPAGGVLAGTYPNPTLADNAVISANITDFNVTGSKIADGAITCAKLSPSPSIPADEGKLIAVGSGGTFAYMAAGAGSSPIGPAGGDLSGTYPNPTAVKASGNFTVTGILTVPGAAGTPAFTFGHRTIKGRLQSLGANDAHYLTSNGILNAAGGAWTQDDAAKPTWILALTPISDNMGVQRIGPGGAGGAQLLTLDATGGLTTVGTAFTFGSSLAKERLINIPSNDAALLTWNNNWSGSAWVRDDTAKAAFNLTIGGYFEWHYYNTAGTFVGAMFSVSSAGDLIIKGSLGQKASGTTWANPSDQRMKRNIADYGTGLDAIKQLRPVSFEYNGEYGTIDTGETCYGYIAQEVEPIMPECVGERDYEGTMVKTLDQSNILLALVNAVKELGARVAALETPA